MGCNDDRTEAVTRAALTESEAAAAAGAAPAEDEAAHLDFEAWDSRLPGGRRPVYEGGPVRAHETARLDELESLPTPHARADARNELLDQLLRERLEEAGVLEQVERDPAGSARLVEHYAAELREEFEHALAADDAAFFEEEVAEAARHWEPTEAEVAAAEATLAALRHGGDSEERGSVGSYGPEAMRARAAELATLEGGAR